MFVPIQLLCIYVHFKARFQLDRVMVLINRDLLEPAPDQHFVEFRQFGRLASDKILKCCDTLDLFVSCYRINGGLLFQFPEPEDFIGNLIVGFLAVGLFEQFLLQGQ